MNRWNIPGWLENEVKKRDKTCVYCGIEMLDQILPQVSRRSAATWEHIINEQESLPVKTLPGVASRAIQARGQKTFLFGFSPVIVESGESTKIPWQRL